MTAVDLSLLVERIRAEVVGRGHIPSPVFDASATDAVRIVHARRAADVYIAARLSMVLNHLESARVPLRPGPATPDVVADARIALGEYDTFLDLQSGVTA